MASKKLGLRLILTTTGSLAQGRRIAKELLKSRLAGCVGLLPQMESAYRWKGRLERSRECLLLIKTASAHVAPLLQRLKAIHPYEVPEMLVLPIERSDRSYERWLVGELSAR